MTSLQKPHHHLRRAIPWPLAAMPFYTVGVLSPVPFLYAAIKRGGRTLWITFSVYLALWITMWVFAAELDTVAWTNDAFPPLLFGLALFGTAHAFILRAVLPPDRRAEPEPEAVDTMGDAGQTTVARVRTELTTLTSFVTTNAVSFPPACKTLLDETLARMDQVVTFVEHGGSDAGQLDSVESIATNYLPDSINTYLRIPKEFATTQRNPDGKTPADELEEQVRLLRDKASDIASTVYRGDALHLEQQTEFLQSKYGKSELDLQ